MEPYLPRMKHGSNWRRWISVMMAAAIFTVGAPLAPAVAAPCGNASMAVPGPMPTMDMKSMPGKSQVPAKRHGVPCGDAGLNCVAGTCAAPAGVPSAVAFLPRISTVDASWTVQIETPDIAHKPALPPPIVRV